MFKFNIGLTVGTVASVAGLGLEAWNTRRRLKQVELKMRVESTRHLHKDYVPVSSCLDVVSRFYNDYKKENLSKPTDIAVSNLSDPEVRRQAALEWAKRKGSADTLTDRDSKVNTCRKESKAFFEMAYNLLSDKAVSERDFQEHYYANSGNFLKLVEPLDEANFIVNFSHVGNYYGGNNRPAIYKKIEEAMKDPAKKDHF
eukprot:m.4658 g.4658  ORF g.4658 m.4658 type:complete len:200 (+) comp11082_c0_seq1:46-645(+)